VLVDALARRRRAIELQEGKTVGQARGGRERGKIMKKGSDMDAKETTEREVGRRLPYSDPHAPITSFRCDYALRKQGNEGEIWRQQHHGFSDRVVAWVKRKIFLYNVTTGLYMLDWWERYLFSILFLIFLLPYLLLSTALFCSLQLPQVKLEGHKVFVLEVT
jgi:hypothetical protein